MSSLNLPLSDNDREFIEAQAAADGYASPELYLQGLIHEQQKRKARERVESLLLESLTEPATEMTQDDWAQLRAELEQQIEAQLLEGINSPSEEVTPQWWDRFRAGLRSRDVPDTRR